jgi:phospholipase/carboxylesterase
MLALHAGLRRKRAPRAILGYSGLLVTPPDGAPPRDMAGQRPPPAILLVHGEEDQLIPIDALLLSTDLLAEAGLSAQWHMSPGLAHGIDNAGLLHGGLFLAQSFGIAVDFKTRAGGTPAR